MLRASVKRQIPQYKFGQTSLSKAFGKLPTEKKAAVDAGVKTTTLANGTKIVTHDREGAQVSLGVYVDAGPKYDPMTAPGLSHVMRFALLTSNYENSLFQIDRTMRSTGFAYGHNEIRKRFVAIKGDGRRDMWAAPFQALATCLTAPRFHEPDVERFRDTIDALLQEQRWQKPRDYVVDQLETVAFFKEPLGNPRLVPAFANDKCSSEAMLNQYASLYVPSAVTIAGVNVAHNDLISAYDSLAYPHSGSAPHHANAARSTLSHTEEAAQFHAGRQFVEYENRAKEMGTRPDQEDEVVAAVGWITNGRDQSIKAFATSLVFTEAYNIALNDGIRYSDDINGLRTFYRPYSSAGLVGITARGAPADVPKLLRDGAASLPKTVENATLVAARARASLRFQNDELELGRDYADFLGTSKHSAEEIFAAIEGVSAVDLREAIEKLRSSKPAVFATGKTHDFPSIQALSLKY